MSDKFSPGKPKGPEQEISLSDLLPDLLDPPVAPPRSAPVPAVVPPRSAPAPAPVPPLNRPAELFSSSAEVTPKPVGFGDLKPLLLMGLALILLPLIALGVFLLIANSQALPTPEELARAAQTPVPTVFSVTPLPTTKAATPLPDNCATGPAFGLVDAYPCARQTDSLQNWEAFFGGLADPQISQNGVHLIGTLKRYDLTADRPDTVLAFYAKSLKAKGYAPTRPTAAGDTSIGSYRADLYAKGSQQVLILALTLNRASPDNSARVGETVIRFNSN